LRRKSAPPEKIFATPMPSHPVMSHGPINAPLLHCSDFSIIFTFTYTVTVLQAAATAGKGDNGNCFR